MRDYDASKGCWENQKKASCPLYGKDSLFVCFPLLFLAVNSTFFFSHNWRIGKEQSTSKMEVEYFFAPQLMKCADTNWTECVEKALLLTAFK